MQSGFENIWALLQPALQKHADTPAWICRAGERRVVTHREIYDAALTQADQLRARGVGADDSVGIIAPNLPEFGVAALAAWKIGAAVAPIHIGNSAHEIAAQLAALSPKVLLAHECEHQNAIAISLTADPEAIAREINISATHGAHHPAARIYTSGSTGNPKVVRLSHANFISNLRAAARMKNFTARDRFIALLPLSHAMGLMATLLLPLWRGAAIVTPRVLAAAEIMDALQQEKVSVVIAVPRLYRNVMLGMEKKFAAAGGMLATYRAVLKCLPVALRRRLNAPLRKKLGGKIKVWVSGGSHLDGKITRFYHDLGLPLRQGYGLTETAPLTSIQTEFDAAADSVGKPIEHVEVKIHQPDDGGHGEVWIRGPNVMLGYDDPQQTAAAMHDGWFKSGDIGRVDSRGRIFLTGRSKRLIVTDAGKNIYPEELETLLERDAAVAEAGVLEMNQKPVCVLAMRDTENKLSTADKTAAAKKTLAAFNQLVSSHNRISRFALVDELPRTPLGKMALQALPEIFSQYEVTK